MRRALLLALSAGLLAADGALAWQQPIVVYFVRHAERADDGTSDPPLSEAGLERSVLLTQMLSDAGVTHVHSTDLKRTRQTGALLAARQGLPLAFYDPGDLGGLAEEVRATPGRHLVLGHSNTTPEAVAALGGEPGGPIDDAEYDRLYVVSVAPDGSVATVILRYGALFEPSSEPPRGMGR